jgi:hypothetical protein
MGWGSDDAQERRPRPRWMTLLTVLMLLLGGRLFITSASDLHRVVTGAAEVLSLDGSQDAQQEALLRGQVVLSNALSRHRPISLAVHAVARLLLGLIYLFAVAAVFSGDQRGRFVSVLAGWAGLAVSVGHVLFVLGVVRGMLPWLEPMLAYAFAEDAARAGRPAFSPDVVAAQARVFLVDVPLVVAGAAILWSLLLIAYFGGRRARLFYNQPWQAPHD